MLIKKISLSSFLVISLIVLGFLILVSIVFDRVLGSDLVNQIMS
jgi:hypothetical protein